ncbi:MAG: hypothetical protein BWY72_01188 [Bacteroidetes bacterium ADurb.Bin416]|nr:MAG: hypothetical protein BWY72_01188 [Bacteroidetes bacterium ADurb.Bin416]
MVGVFEVGHEGGGVGGCNTQTLVIVRGRKVGRTVGPACGNQINGVEAVGEGVENIEYNLAFVLQLGLVVLSAQQVVHQLKLGLDVIAPLVIRSQVG